MKYTIETNTKEPWKGDEKVCVCGARFEHPANTKQKKQAWSYHLNDCKQFKAAKAAEERREVETEAQIEHDFKVSQLIEEGCFTFEQAEILIKVFG